MEQRAFRLEETSMVHRGRAGGQESPARFRCVPLVGMITLPIEITVGLVPESLHVSEIIGI